MSPRFSRNYEGGKKMKLRGRIFVIFVMISFFNIFTVWADQIRLKNGDRISGKVVRMQDGKLVFETSYAGEISIEWSEVLSLMAEDALKVELSDETAVEGMTKPTEGGKMKLLTEKITEPVSFDLADVKAINRASEPTVKFKGHVNVGLRKTDGNTDTETAHFDGEFVARTAKNRYTLGAEYNRAEDQGEKTAKNIIGFGKYDHFLTEKWYLYSNVFFEKDEFKDLNLRSSIGAGAGYQFFETPIMNLSLEAGLTYVNEDFEEALDDDYPAGRWSLDFDRYFFNKIIQFFHFHEGSVGLEDTDDMFIRTRTGIRVPVYKNLKATAQYNFDWDRSPTPGREKEDEMYIFMLGYHR